MVIVKTLQFANALLPIDETLFGILSSSSEEQPQNEYADISDNVRGRLKSDKAEHPSNA